MSKKFILLLNSSFQYLSITSGLSINSSDMHEVVKKEIKQEKNKNSEKKSEGSYHRLKFSIGQSMITT